MKVSVGLPTQRGRGELCTGAVIADVAATAEGLGFDAVFVTDHPFPTERWLSTGGHHALDPFVALSFAAAATTRLRLHTNLLVPSYRNPFLTAKAIATLDALSGGRMIVGLGAGYLRGEFEALGVDFDERNALTDEAIVAMRSAWSGEPVTMDGRHWRAEGNRMLPVPVQPGGPPLWIGGNSRRAIRRAVELADGWIPMPSPAGSERRLKTPSISSLDELSERIQLARRLCDDAGRETPLELVFMPLGLDMFTNAEIDAELVIESTRAMADVGVTYATITLPGDDRQAFVANLTRFGEQVLPEL